MDTICAISTPPGNGGIGIVRLSGKDALEIALSVFDAGSFSIEPKKMHFGTFNGSEFKDKGYLVYFKAPASFTGEDVVEFHLHGGMRLLKGVIADLLAKGARLAENGEFTKRAFLNGKLSLADAEGVINMISAERAASLRAAYRLMKGELTEKIEDIESEIYDLASSLEASLDYPAEMEDEVLPLSEEVLSRSLDKIRALLKSFKAGRRAKNGVNVVLTGEVNAGKSSLMNAFLGFERTIVTDIPGTTRDIVTETLEYNGVKLIITDTAGIRESAETIEKIGIERAKEALKSADAVLELSPSGVFTYKPLEGQEYFKVQTKCDLNRDKLGIKGGVYGISAKTGEGVEALLEALANLAGSQDAEFITEERHYSLLKQAESNLEDALRAKGTVDLMIVGLRAAADCMGKITGKVASEEIIDGIFKKFCVGK